MSNICILFQQFAELFYTSYMCMLFLAARRPVVHDAYAYLFSAVHRLALHAMHMHTFFSRTPTCSTCHTYAYLFQAYTDLFYMLYICIPFSAGSRPVLHVIHMHTIFSRKPTCSTCHTGYEYLFSDRGRSVLHVMHMHTFFIRKPRSKKA